MWARVPLDPIQETEYEQNASDSSGQAQEAATSALNTLIESPLRVELVCSILRRLESQLRTEALISIVAPNAHHVWTRSEFRATPSARHTTPSDSFFDHILATEKFLLLQDATIDPRFCRRLTAHSKTVRFFAGVPILHQRCSVGTLCVFYRRRRDRLATMQLRATHTTFCECSASSYVHATPPRTTGTTSLCVCCAHRRLVDGRHRIGTTSLRAINPDVQHPIKQRAQFATISLCELHKIRVKQRIQLMQQR